MKSPDHWQWHSSHKYPILQNYVRIYDHYELLCRWSRRQQTWNTASGESDTPQRAAWRSATLSPPTRPWRTSPRTEHPRSKLTRQEKSNQSFETLWTFFWFNTSVIIIKTKLFFVMCHFLLKLWLLLFCWGIELFIYYIDFPVLTCIHPVELDSFGTERIWFQRQLQNGPD